MNTVFEITAMCSLLVASVVVTVGLFTVAIAVFTRVLLKQTFSECMKNGNAAVAVVLGAVVLSIALLTSPTVLALRQNLQLAASLGSSERMSYVISTAWLGIIQFLVAFVLAILAGVVSTKLFDLLTRGVNEYEQLGSRANIAVAIMLAAILLGLTVIIREPLDALVSILIPLPQMVIPR